MNVDQGGLELNRRDFLKGGSTATIMTMLGATQILADTETTSESSEPEGPKIKVGLIGLGAWGGRDLITTLAQVTQADIAAICDTYPAALKRCAESAPAAVRTEKYEAILEDKDIRVVLIATPTHQHKEIVLTALKAGKHVYCEAPLAQSIEEAQEIAKAGLAAKPMVFQSGLQFRADKERLFLLPFLQSGKHYSDGMDDVMWKKLKVQDSLKIVYRLTELTLKETPKDKYSPYVFDSKGEVAVAGITNAVAFPVDVLPMPGDKIKISGKTSLKMTDFKIEPPAPTLGLGALKTGDEVKISFEWILGLKTPAAAAK